MARLTIPKGVREHWSERLDEIARGHAPDPTDVTYAKILSVRYDRIAVIDTDHADLKELESECRNWLETETFVAIGETQEDRYFRSAYRLLLNNVQKAKSQIQPTKTTKRPTPFV
jgi:hypothetical protein